MTLMKCSSAATRDRVEQSTIINKSINTAFLRAPLQYTLRCNTSDRRNVTVHSSLFIVSSAVQVVAVPILCTSLVRTAFSGGSRMALMDLLQEYALVSIYVLRIYGSV